MRAVGAFDMGVKFRRLWWHVTPWASEENDKRKKSSLGFLSPLPCSACCF
jgi:hypothetical protein